MQTWEQVLRNSREDDKGKWDAEANVEDVHATSTNGALELRSGEKLRASMTDLSFGQLCGRLGVPAGYAKRIPAHLAAQCLNHDLQRLAGENRPPKFLIRMKGEVCRAFLSDQYSPVGNTEVLEIVERFGRGFRHAVRQVHFDERGIWLKLLVEDLEVPDPTRKDMPLKVGVMVGNSEVGTRSLTVEPFVYRKACTNDLVVQQESSVSVRHVHLKAAEIRYRVTTAVNGAIKSGSGLLDAFAQSRELRVEDPAEVIRQLAARRAMPSKLHDEVRLAHAAEGSERNAFAVINAFTQAARTLEGDDRVDLERYAGELLLTSRKWAGR